MKECPSCAMMIEKASEVCPICGYEFPKTGKINQWVAIGLIILFILYLLF